MVRSPRLLSEGIMVGKKVTFAGYELLLDNGDVKVVREKTDLSPGDYGADPVGDGMFRMVPSGDIVTYEERCARLARRERA